MRETIRDLLIPKRAKTCETKYVVRIIFQYDGQWWREFTREWNYIFVYTHSSTQWPAVAIQFSFNSAPPHRCVLENPKNDVRLTDTCATREDRMSGMHKRTEKYFFLKSFTLLMSETYLPRVTAERGVLSADDSHFVSRMQWRLAASYKRRIVRN